MSGIFKIDRDLIKCIFERAKASVEDGKGVEVWKRERGLPSNELLIESVSSCLSAELVEHLIETCFVASLETEEGQFYNFSVALKPPECEKGQMFRFSTGIKFNASSLAKLAPAVNPNIHCINLWFNGDDLEIWGFSEKSYPHFTITTSSSGKIILDCFFGLKKTFKTFLSMAETGFVSLKSHGNPVADWLNKHATIEEKLGRFQRNNDLGDILMNMFSHGNGGAVLLVQNDESSWMESIQKPFLYAGLEPYLDKRIKERNSTISEYFEKEYGRIDERTLEKISEGTFLNIQLDQEFNYQLSISEQNAKKALLDIADLTKVDGAVVLSRNFEMLAFGATIIPKKLNEEDERKENISIRVITPFEDFNPESKFISDITGKRHQSAAQFAFDQKNCMSVVASHDGRLSVFWWSDEINTVVMMKNYEAMIGG